MECGTNYACILNDNSSFLPTEYKVLQSQKGGCFVKCMRMLYNGKTELYYFSGELKPLSTVLLSIDESYSPSWDLSIATLKGGFLSRADQYFLDLVRQTFAQEPNDK